MSSDSSHGAHASASQLNSGSRSERRKRSNPSSGAGQIATTAQADPCAPAWIAWNPPMLDPLSATFGACARNRSAIASASSKARSEEHTSELQSHSDLVCRLLLE